MTATWLKTALVATGLVPAMLQAQIGLTIDNKLLFPLDSTPSDLDAPSYVIDGGFAERDGNPAIQYRLADARLVMQTRYADLTCEYFSASGQPVDPPAGNFTVEIDRIPTPVGDTDPNIDFLGNPIVREFPLDVGNGASITQMYLAEGAVLDICSSLYGCGDPQGIHLRCRQAGTAVFAGDFEPPILNLVGAATASTPTVVAGAGSFDLEFEITNLGDLAATDLVMLVDLDDLPPGVVAAAAPQPSVGSFDAGTGEWDIGLLEAGLSATLSFAFSAAASAPDAVDFCGAMTLGSVTGDPINPAAADAATCVELVRRVDLVTAALEDPETADPADISNGDVSYSYIFSVDNDGPSIATGVVMALDLQLPPGVSLDAVVPINGSYDGQTGLWTLGAISPGSLDRRLRVDVTVTQGTTPGIDVICAGISVDSVAEQRINPGDDQVQECTSVIGPPTVDLVAEVELSSAAPVAGSGSGNLVVVHRITNNTSIEATGIQATVDAVNLPPSVTLVSEQVGSGSMLNGTLWEIPSLLPGQSIEISRTFTVDAAALSGDQVCGAVGSLAANEDLISTGDDADAACATIARQVDLVVQVFNTASTVEPGSSPGTPTFQFSVTNLGPSNASNIQLALSELPLPTDVTRSTTFTVGGSLVGSTWTVGSLAAGQAPVTLTLGYTVGSSAPVGETIEAGLALQSVAAGEQIVNPSNDSATTVSQIVAP